MRHCRLKEPDEKSKPVVQVMLTTVPGGEELGKVDVLIFSPVGKLQFSAEYNVEKKAIT